MAFDFTGKLVLVTAVTQASALRFPKGVVAGGGRSCLLFR